MQALCELDGHASTDQIYRRVTLQRRDVDLSTVYRTMEMLRDLRIVSEIDMGRGCAEYEIVAERPHHHLVCQGCGQELELDHVYLATMGQAIHQDTGFKPILDHFAIFGLCPACQEAETAS